MRFNSRLFVEDEFFATSGEADPGLVAIDSNDYPCSYTDELHPQKHAPLIAQGGHWRIIYIKDEDWEAVNGIGNLPILQSKCTFTEGDVTREFFVKTRYRDGDLIVLQALGDQRKNR